MSGFHVNHLIVNAILFYSKLHQTFRMWHLKYNRTLELWTSELHNVQLYVHQI